ncbi:ABC transporter permease [Streptomyces sp. NPDC054904]
MKRPGCLAMVVSAVILLGLLGWGAKSMLDSSFEGPDNHVAATDPRVCPQTQGNNLSLADATEHFGLAVPADATGLVFTATAGGLQGESNLMLRFTTTPADLATFLTASHFEPPSATTQVLTGSWFTYRPGVAVLPAEGPCALTPPGNPSMVYSQDSASDAKRTSPRSLAVDNTDPAHPVVWVSGADL